MTQGLQNYYMHNPLDFELDNESFRKLLDAEGTLDIELLENYIADHLGGIIGKEYAEPQGRITFTEGYASN